MFTYSFKIQKHVMHVCEVKVLQSCLWHLVVLAAAPSSSAWPWGSSCRQDVVLEGPTAVSPEVWRGFLWFH